MSFNFSQGVSNSLAHMSHEHKTGSKLANFKN